jgi:hypothetical protein
MVGEEVVAMSLFGRRSPSRGGQEVQDVSNHRAGARRGPAQLVLRVGVPALIVMSLLVVLPTAYAATPPPKNTSLPTISGTPLVAQKLTASTGSWTGKPTRYAYQWQRCNGSGGGCTPISGATSSSYTVSSSDVGGTLKVMVTATNAGGSGSAGSAPTTVVQAAPPVNTAPPTTNGTATDGQLLSASAGGWSGTQPISYSYQWQRCTSGGAGCTPISGATSSSYTVSSSDVGSTLKVTVTATNAGGSAAAVSVATQVVTGPSSTPGTTYYVDCNGSDSNDGLSPASAWATLTKADAALLKPGDALVLKRGCTFTSTLTAKWNGTAASPIVIEAYGSGSNPLIQLDAGGIATSRVGVEVSGSYQTIQDLQTRVINPYLNTSCLQSDGTGVPDGWYVGFDVGGSYNTLANLDASSASVGVAMDDTAAHNRILSNHLHGMHDLWQVDEAHGAMGGMGIDLHGQSNELAYNLIEDNGASCTFADGATNAYSAAFEVYNANNNYVHHNVAYGHDKQFEMGHDSTHTTDNNVLAYNLFYSGYPGADGPNIHGSNSSYGPVNNTQIYNNTIVLTGSGTQALVCGCSGGAVIRNNILVATYKSAYYKGSILESNNDYWNYSGSTFVQFNGATQSTISSTSKIADPAFVDATSDFDLQPTSPDVDAGTLISTDPLLAYLLSYDLNNGSVPSGGAPDIGAYEYGG